MAILPVSWAIRKGAKWKSLTIYVNEMKSRHNGTFSNTNRFPQMIRKVANGSIKEVLVKDDNY